MTEKPQHFTSPSMVWSWARYLVTAGVLDKNGVTVGRLLSNNGGDWSIMYAARMAADNPGLYTAWCAANRMNDVTFPTPWKPAVPPRRRRR